jgi:hypothetical protein
LVSDKSLTFFYSAVSLSLLENISSYKIEEHNSVAHYLYSATGPAADSMAGLPMLLAQLLLLLAAAGLRPGEPVREQNWCTSCLLGAVPGAPSPRIPAAPRRRGEIACRMETFTSHLNGHLKGTVRICMRVVSLDRA